VARLAERPAWKRSILTDAKAFQPEKAAS